MDCIPFISLVANSRFCCLGAVCLMARLSICQFKWVAAATHIRVNVRSCCFLVSIFGHLIRQLLVGPIRPAKKMRLKRHRPHARFECDYMRHQTNQGDIRTTRHNTTHDWRSFLTVEYIGHIIRHFTSLLVRVCIAVIHPGERHMAQMLAQMSLFCENIESPDFQLILC